jgi:hypothetical protein
LLDICAVFVIGHLAIDAAHTNKELNNNNNNNNYYYYYITRVSIVRPYHPCFLVFGRPQVQNSASSLVIPIDTFDTFPQSAHGSAP